MMYAIGTKRTLLDASRSKMTQSGQLYMLAVRTITDGG